MALTEKERVTLQYYDTHAQEWIDGSRPGEPSFWQPELSRFHELLPTGKVLEIGSGSGRDAATLMDLGYDYTGVDASEGLLEIARKTIPQGTFLHQSVYDIDFPEGTFDGFWTAATLLHVPKAQMQEALRRIQSVVKSQGIGFISLKEGEGEVIDEKTGRLFSYYSIDEFSEVLRGVQMDIVDPTVSRRQESTRTDYLTFFVRNIAI